MYIICPPIFNRSGALNAIVTGCPHVVSLPAPSHDFDSSSILFLFCFVFLRKNPEHFHFHFSLFFISYKGLKLPSIFISFHSDFSRSSSMPQPR